MIETTPTPPRDITTSLFTVKQGVSVEDALILASEYLTCAAATAHETADNSSKEYRPLARAVVHQIEAALALVEASVVGLEKRPLAV
ncbi:DUF6124 family protein [Pseudomonas lijiangensis]|uniref:DUF3077 domain-containing protein n=1 Tax=Pseudomonas lijiangensis TaxID=2995658 RepID=A0ABX8HRG6_9PSED|nr:DUF3077 domain-containing protein [Pseudomonas lijiangensis]MBX8501704.1 DUF3077 domain-containing protein [Pseudomonas lijiangensis]MBX8506539.1 DUF3077 domain-containing protein [Pseudomonas lijiangensis]QWU83042.1 DUF3077 domain-containing protein [Pseudomonas lijiangensis]